ncbi:MAG: ATP-binding cassette domain-containing protein [Alphaproteobacteria bacterium]|jgi:phospholipid/cholesterol/gamma-HCH transport system ATP-binding protein|nr:ATP-binding cassette domain-containing protein [Alphaproteobacteria bacterium]MBT5390064.1 ATP-binding cassette domain-containing protein [Alphaproteobacteria bacterium]MBT5655124.1 ATP-binding cassette domain-containing protein [Alphaproteobacteria bacterium]
MSEFAIRIKNLSKSFNGKKVLNNLSLDIKKGESLVILGGSGSGKSVLLRCILGLIKPTTGQIIVNGVETSRNRNVLPKEVMKNIGMLFQGSALFDSLPVWQNIAFGLVHSMKLPKDEAKKIALKTLSMVGLPQSAADLWPAELSGGMQKRVSLARAIATSPDILFFDEPTTGLDPILCSVIDHLIIKNVRELGATAISITHDIKSAKTIADRIAMLYGGKIIWTGTSKDLLKSDNPYVSQFVHGKTSGPIRLEGVKSKG